jgi:rfaE bifunctional protein kinase chain/domain
MLQTDIDTLFGHFSSVKVGVIGDVMLDTYWWGHVDRISPEAPVPVVALDRKEQRIGGAGNVALNLASLGAQVSLLSVVGKDDDAIALRGLLEKHHIQSGYLLDSSARITTNKARIISRNQQMLRLDAEMTKDLSSTDESALLDALKKYILEEKPAVVIFEDYNKGVLTERVIEKAIGLCSNNGIITAVDPKRKHFFSYQYVDIFKPNLKEVREGLNLIDEEPGPDFLQNIHHKLKEQLHHHISLITLSEKGIFYCNDKEWKIIPSHLRNIADVSGAGDTVIAVASLVYALTRNLQLMAEMANIAGGLVCEEVGTAAINKELLQRECLRLITKS